MDPLIVIFELLIIILKTGEVYDAQYKIRQVSVFSV